MTTSATCTPRARLGSRRRRKRKRRPKPSARRRKRTPRKHTRSSSTRSKARERTGRRVRRRSYGRAMIRARVLPTCPPSNPRRICPVRLKRPQRYVVFCFVSAWLSMVFVQRPASPPPAPPKPKGKRAMDSFLEEIKRSVLTVFRTMKGASLAEQRPSGQRG